MKIQAVTLHQDHLKVTWETGNRSTFHYLWLRENCPSGNHHETGERVLDPMDISLDTIATNALATDDGSLSVKWNTGHKSLFDPNWLYAFRYEREAVLERKFKPTLWDAPSIQDHLPEVEYDAVMTDDSALLDWLCKLRDIGFCFVRNAPTEEGIVGPLAERIGYLRETNYGTIFDVKSKPNPDSVAYTSVKLHAHTDLTPREVQPGIQFLHCIEFEATGGESILVDGHRVAQELKARHPEHYELLTTTPLRFRYIGPDSDLTWVSEMIKLDGDGDIQEMRYTTALRSPLEIPMEKVVPFYHAYYAFTELLRDPQFELQFALQPGDIMTFENRRVLHGRAEFDPQSGPRHLQGTYVDGDDFYSKIRVLERQQ